MKKIKQIFCGLFIAALTVAPAVATQNVSRVATNSDRARAVGTVSSASARTKQPVVMQRGAGTATTSSRARTTVGQRGNNVATRAATVTQKRVVRSPSRVSRAAHILSDAGDIIIRRALGISRAASNKRVSRAATNGKHARSAMPANIARATAVFSDISKMGEGYTRCRESYNTCMDQFCAGMNETYRRCFCSDNFRNLRDKEEAMDAATTMLAKFEDNNLNAVSLSADEVNAMYSATAGESAIKKDTSASVALLDEIGDLLSGKKKASQANTSMTSLNGLSIDFSSDLGDIWGSSSDSLFGDNSGVDLTTLEGAELYTNAHNQCMQMVSSSCENGAVKTMTKSAYSVLITQDCNAYQKKLDSKMEKVKQTVRQAEKYLREARLDEYRAHNSADVNECMDKVEQAILAPTACGPDYVKCLDYSGVYINASTGDPIYSARLFGLNEIIQLDGTADVLSQNQEFNTFLDSKRMYAASALDTCRTIADTVWTEFKRNALIKISQAQDEKIEEVKMSCVSTMKECYDTQSGALKSFDDTTAQASAALAARASRDMCSDKVIACAALYGDSDGCKVDTKTNKVTAVSDKKCGLQSLMNFVNNVDDVRIAEGCASAIDSYLKQTCTPTNDAEHSYPWNCRLRKFGNVNAINWSTKPTNSNDMSMIDMVVRYAYDNCGDEIAKESRTQEQVNLALRNLHEEMNNLMVDACMDAEGIWIDTEYNANAGGLSTGNGIETFYQQVFKTTYAGAQEKYGADSWGRCVKNDVQARCVAEDQATGGNGWATYNAATGACEFTTDYYRYQCEHVRGIWANNHCYVGQ